MDFEKACPASVRQPSGNLSGNLLFGWRRPPLGLMPVEALVN